MIKLGLSRVHFPVSTLGPGNRLGIWFQGCSLRCQGCISTDTWVKAKDFIAVSQFVEQIMPWLMQAEGITISGGEPFEQPEALLALLKQLKQKTTVDILLYTGYSIEAIEHHIQQVKPYLDVLISDPFQSETAQTLRLRGSDNQRLHFFTNLGKERFKDYQQVISKQDQVLDVMFDEDGTVWFAGIPKRDDLLRLQSFLKQQGHQIKVTADKSKH